LVQYILLGFPNACIISHITLVVILHYLVIHYKQPTMHAVFWIYDRTPYGTLKIRLQQQLLLLLLLLLMLLWRIGFTAVRSLIGPSVIF